MIWVTEGMKSLEYNKHRTWAEIDLNTIEHNFRMIQKHVGDCPILAVIKADAYGHGSVRVAERLVRGRRGTLRGGDGPRSSSPA